jgi:hypothetical protein
MDNEIKGEGNSLNYKYRMHDPRVGRFFAVDPLAPKYPHNSPYAFSENIVINAVELEGLEKIAFNGTGNGSNYHVGDAEAFKRRAERLHSRGYESVTVSTGKDIFEALKKETIDAGQITRVAIFSHGWELGIAMNPDAGLHTGDIEQSTGSKTIGNLVQEINSGNISFSDDAIIYIGACNCAKPYSDTKLSFSYQLTKQTGVTTVSPTGLVEPLYDENGVNIGMKTTKTFLKMTKITQYSVTVNIDGKDYKKTFNSEVEATKFMNKSKVLAAQYNKVGGKAKVGEVVENSYVKVEDVGNEIKYEEME